MVILKSLNEQIQITIHEGQNLLLGRLLKCDVALEDPSISSQHARLKLENDHLQVVDMDSTNGTRLNYSVLTEPAFLQDGDTIEFGNVTFTVDGPTLTLPEDPDQELVSLEPIEASQKMADTMVAMQLSEEEMAEADVEHTQPPQTQPADEPLEPDFLQPLRTAFFLALVLILVSGALLLMVLWKIPPQI